MHIISGWKRFLTVLLDTTLGFSTCSRSKRYIYKDMIIQLFNSVRGMDGNCDLFVGRAGAGLWD